MRMRMRKMGCFTACFRSSKLSPPNHQPQPQPPPQIHDLHIKPLSGSLLLPIPQSLEDDSDKVEQLNPSIENIQFVSDVDKTKEKTHECITVLEGDAVIEENREKEECTVSDSSVSSYISYPPLHRYTINNNGEFQEVNSKIDQESSESLFSLSIESRKQLYVIESEEVSSALRIHSVLNPMENDNQGTVFKSRTTPLILNHPQDEKENLNTEQELICEEPSLASSNLRPKVRKMEVDTSLSSWLVGSPTSEDSLNSRLVQRGIRSCTSFEKRQVLGELDVGDIKQLSVCSAPRDEVAILGALSRKAPDLVNC